METNREHLESQLADAERGESLAWTGYRNAAWVPVAMGLWAGSFSLGLAYLDGLIGNLWSLLHLVAALGFMWFDRRRQTFMPSFRSEAPREYHRPTLVLFGGSVVVALAAWAVGWWVAGWAGALLAAAAWGGLVALYQRQYAAASARVSERLA